MFFLIFALLVGGYIRLFDVFNSRIPLNDGGLFFSMTQDLVNNQFRLPVYATYNNLQIPFAYPPLAFYITGSLHTLFGWELFDLIHVLPGLFSFMTIPIFYLFAKKIILSDLQLGFATIIFSLTPATFDWMIMGGGITRALGYIFTLLTLISSLQIFSTNRTTKSIIETTLFTSLAILSHPETFIPITAAILGLCIFFKVNRKIITKIIIITFLTFVLTSPWWGSVIKNHGFDPFISALHAGIGQSENLLRILIPNLANEPFLQLSTLLGFLGMYILLARKLFLLPILFCALFLTVTKSGWRYIAIIIALISSYSIMFFFDNLIPKVRKQNDKNNQRVLITPFWAKLLFIHFVIIWIISSFYTVFMYRNKASLTNEELSAFHWVNTNTTPKSTFLLLTGRDPTQYDPTSEWFPALTQRKNISTIYGREWLRDEVFIDVIKASKTVQKCVFEDLKCIDTWFLDNNEKVNYIIVDNNYGYFHGDQLLQINFSIFNSLNNSKDYSLVYKNNMVSIFKRIN